MQRSAGNNAGTEVPLEKTISTWTIGEDPQPHREALRRLFEAGVSRVFIHSPQQDQRRVIDFYARQVLPSLQLETTRR